MPATVTVASTYGKEASAPTFIHKLTVLGDSSYPTGGYELSLSTKLPSKTIIACWAEPQAGYAFQYDAVNDKLLFIVGSTFAEVGSGQNMSAVTATIFVLAE